MNPLSLIPLPYKVAGIAALCALVTAGGWWLHHSIAQGGYDRCMADNRAAQAEAEQEAQQTHGKIQKNIMALPAPDLDKRLSRWLR